MRKVLHGRLEGSHDLEGASAKDAPIEQGEPDLGLCFILSHWWAEVSPCIRSPSSRLGPGPDVDNKTPFPVQWSSRSHQ